MPRKRRAGLTPYPGDVALIKEYKSAAPGSGVSPQTAMAQGSTLNSFSHYLRENNRPGIAGRLHDDKSLDEDVERYRVTDKRIRPAIANLRKALPRGEGLWAGVMPAGERRGPPLNPPAVAVTLRCPKVAPLTISRSGNHATPQLWDRAIGTAEAVSAKAGGPVAASNVQFILHVVPMSEARPAAPPAPRDKYGDLESLVELPSTPQELRDDAQSAPVPARSDAQTGAVAPTPRLHRVPELGAREWLGDNHILADFLILGHELQASNPALAARMRFVDPLVAHYHLRLGLDSVAQNAFQGLVHDRAGNDTADFLFLPVNDANAAEPGSGTHWSLLLVDRRDRARPVAYHYDSVRGYHDEFAQQLARRFGARLERPGMAQQRNSYDCGVYVVDGARELVRRLAQRQTPAVLNLDNLVVDRAAVQNRLRH
ncbi:hypothetical protein GCM10007880_66910 [Mesorhizobium amorphae]|nr:hypothetical protein GCM10007880_66910 [Mesorhizobium amorphae]